MGLFDGPLFDFNGDGREDEDEIFVGLQMVAGSRREAIELTGDDTFYPGSDKLDDEDIEDELEMAGLDINALADMDYEERRETIEEAGLDPDDYSDF